MQSVQTLHDAHMATSPPPSFALAERPGCLGSLAATWRLVSLLAVIQVADLVLRFISDGGLSLTGLGVRPREAWGLLGIPLAPFLHAGPPHLLANAGSLLLLGTMCRWYDPRLAESAWAWATLLGGLCAWALGEAGSIHVGASGCIFGLFGALVANGLVRRRFGAFALALLVFLLWGGALMTVLPTEEVRLQRLSWQMHLGGLIGGIVAAWRGRRTVTVRR